MEISVNPGRVLISFRYIFSSAIKKSILANPEQLQSLYTFSAIFLMSCFCDSLILAGIWTED